MYRQIKNTDGSPTLTAFDFIGNDNSASASFGMALSSIGDISGDRIPGIIINNLLFICFYLSFKNKNAFLFLWIKT